MKASKASTLHGLLLITLFSFAAYYIAAFPVFRALSFSPLIIGIILGMVYANTLRNHLPSEWTPGIVFCSKTVLRTAIVFYGFRLTIQNVMAVGAPGIVVDLIIVSSVLVLGILLGRLLGMDRDTAILTASGSAICGAAAVLGTEPVLESKPYKTAVAVSTVVIFGTISMFLHPALYRSGVLGLSDWQMSIFTGSSLHEVAHVVGAGNAMGRELIASNAIIVKMIRVILLAPALIILGLLFKPKRDADAPVVEGAAQAPRRKVTIPRFAVGFLGAICLNSLIQYLVGDSEMAKGIAEGVIGVVNRLDTFALTMAMTALGAESNFSKFRKAGLKPFLLALILFCWLFGMGFLMAKYLVPMLS